MSVEADAAAAIADVAVAVGLYSRRKTAQKSNPCFACVFSGLLEFFFRVFVYVFKSLFMFLPKKVFLNSKAKRPNLWMDG